MKSLLLALTFFAMISCSSRPPMVQRDTNLPISTEATFRESFSPSEVTIQATGYGGNMEQASIDLRRAAVWFVLKGGTDPVLSKPEERNAFARIAEEFFSEVNINGFITNESQPVRSVWTRRDGQEMLQVEKTVRVDRKRVKDYLVEQKIIEELRDVLDEIGLPFIMVIPEVAKGVNPLDKLANNSTARAGAAAIKSYLTARGYDVQVPEAANVLNELTRLQGELAGVDEDPIAQIAQLIGSDIYITYSITIEEGSQGTRKASVAVKAFETTTARLLGAETGYSPALRISSEQALIENAIGDAVNNVLARVSNYWKEDMERGLQYKITFGISGFSGRQAEDLSDAVVDAVENSFDKTRNLLTTNNTIQYIVWANRDEYSSGNDVYRALRQKIESSVPGIQVERITVNRKFIHAKITPN